MNLKPEIRTTLLALGLEEVDLAIFIETLRRMRTQSEQDAQQAQNLLDHNLTVRSGLMDAVAQHKSQSDAIYRLLAKLSDSDAAQFREQSADEAKASVPEPVVEKSPSPLENPPEPTPVAPAPEPQKVAFAETLRNPFMDIGVA